MEEGESRDTQRGSWIGVWDRVQARRCKERGKYAREVGEGERTHVGEVVGKVEGAGWE